MKSWLAAAARRSLEGPGAAAAARFLTGSRLRIIAYHGVPDVDAFRDQLAEIARAHTFVDEGVVLAGLAGEVCPRNAIWITFDDGHPDVLDGLEVLQEFDALATMFVCPGVINTHEPFWWQTVDEASRLGLANDNGGSRFSRARLKVVSDEKRRTEVCTLAMRIAERIGAPFRVAQLTSQQLKSWSDAGHQVGNHTWDHPLLDGCTDAAQVQQVRLAHDWLVQAGHSPRFFAYPNGNRAKATAAELVDLGYAGSLLFDHRLTHMHRNRQELSRLRLDTNASTRRARSIVSGAHAAAYRLLDK